MAEKIGDFFFLKTVTQLISCQKELELLIPQFPFCSFILALLLVRIAYPMVYTPKVYLQGSFLESTTNIFL